MTRNLENPCDIMLSRGTTLNSINKEFGCILTEYIYNFTKPKIE